MTKHQNSEASGITALYYELLGYWNKRNAMGFASLFTGNGNFIGFDGSQLNGSAEIGSVFAEIFESFPTGKYIAIVKEARELAPGSGLLLAVAGMVPQGTDDISPAVNALHAITVVKEAGGWRIALFQTTPAAFHGRPELTEQLSEDLRRALYLSASGN